MGIGKSINNSVYYSLRNQIHNELAGSLRGSTKISVIGFAYDATNEPLSERFGWQLSKVIKSTTVKNKLFTI